MKVCVLSSGSKGNSTYVETQNCKILIDIGNSCAYIEKSLRSINVEPNTIDVVLITHSHIDHVGGLRVFCKKYHPIVCVSKTILNEAKLEIELFNISNITEVNKIYNITIEKVKLSHDVKEINGYIVSDNRSSMVYITDTGYIPETQYEIIKNKNLYVFESNHDVEMLMNNENYPHSTKIRILSDKGHLSNKDSAYYLTKIIGKNTKNIVLAHLSEQNNTEDLALNNLKEILKTKKINFQNIDVAKQNDVSKVYNI